MNKSEQPMDWKIQAGINYEILRTQMPYLLGYKGEVEVATLPDGNIMIYGGMNRYSQDGQVVYKYNPETQTAQLVSLDTNRNIQGVSRESVMDKIDFNHYMQPESAFEMLATLTGITAEQIKGMFPEASNYDQILLNRTVGSSVIRISFKLPGKPNGISCMYDYDLTTGKLEHTYSNDGNGKVWASWNKQKPKA